MLYIRHGTLVQRSCVKLPFFLNVIHCLRTVQVGTTTRIRDMLNRNEEGIALHDTVGHLEYLGEELSESDQIDVELNRSSLVHGNVFWRMQAILRKSIVGLISHVGI